MNKIGTGGDEEVLSSDHQEKMGDLEKVVKRLKTFICQHHSYYFLVILIILIVLIVLIVILMVGLFIYQVPLITR